MRRKGLGLLVAGVVLLGSMTAFSYAGAKSENENSLDRFKKQEELLGNSKIAQKKDIHEDILKLMEKNGFKNIAKAVEKGDYKAMDEFMNNLTDEDYQKMIDILQNNGYESMARMMESMDRDQMIQMHNAMGGAESCHSSSTNDRMNSF